jgi:hypothetical protein
MDFFIVFFWVLFVLESWTSTHLLCLFLGVASSVSQSKPLRIMWTIKTNTRKHISSQGYVDHQTPKLLSQMARVHFPYNLPFLVIDDNTTKASKYNKHFNENM